MQRTRRLWTRRGLHLLGITGLPMRFVQASLGGWENSAQENGSPHNCHFNLTLNVQT